MGDIATNDGTTGPTATDRAALGLRHQPLRHAVLEAVRDRIIEGDWAPGERLMEDQIAAELAVSRNPVREALQALAAEGFVELEPRRGARVAVVSEERTRELFEMREALEGLVARLAADRRSDVQLRALIRLVEDGRAAAAEQRHDVLPALNTQFHHVLGAAAGNSMLTESVDRLSHLIEWVYRRSIAARSAQSWAEHDAIVRAIEAGDADEAERCARRHVLAARSAYAEMAVTR